MTSRSAGPPPDWYLTVRAARYGNVPAWELDEQPITWQARYLMAESAEADAQAKIHKQAQRKQRNRSRGQ